MDSLPDNVLLSIFCNLRYEDLCLGVRMCSQRWRHLTYDKELWRFIEIPSHFDNNRLKLLLEHVHRHVEELDLSQCDDINQQGLEDMASLQFPRLRKLSVPISGRFTDSLFLKLCQACPKLEELENVSPNFNDTCDPVLCQMLFPAIKVIHDRPVSTYGRIRKHLNLEMDLHKRSRWQNALKRLSESCIYVNSYKCCRGLEYLDGQGIGHVSMTFPNIRELELRHCSITDEGLRSFFTNSKCRGLRELIMDKPGNLTDQALEVIADSCPDLENLKVSRCAGITSSGVLYLTTRCPNLSELHLNNSPSFLEEQKPKSDINNDCLNAISNHCPKLSCFRLFYSSSVTISGFMNLVEGCKYLRGLMLYECTHVDDNCLSIFLGLNFLRALVLVNSLDVTPKGLIDFILVAPRLGRLTFYTKQESFLEDQSILTEQTFEKICREDAQFRPNVMKYLTLRGVGGSFLELITVLCPKLRLLDLRHGSHVDIPSMLNVIKNCEMLEELDTSSCDLQTDAQMLNAICRHCLTLRKLSLGGAGPDVTSEDLFEVVKQCRSLRLLSINLPNWPMLDEDKLAMVARQHHGGHCCVKLDKEIDDEQNYFLDLHFVPIKYLGSIQTADSSQENKTSEENAQMPEVEL